MRATSLVSVKGVIQKYSDIVTLFGNEYHDKQFFTISDTMRAIFFVFPPSTDVTLQ